MELRAATRSSPLARVQTGLVSYLLNCAVAAGDVADPQPDRERSGPDAEVPVRVLSVVVATTGDLNREAPISALAGQGVFVKEVQQAVLDGRADFAVHSAKDLPSTTAAGLVLAAVPPRGDPRDGLVGCRLADLAPGARVGTGSARRRAQLAWLRPDLVFGELRGNIESRLAKAGEFDAIVVAVAALDRLVRSARLTEALDPATMLPQVGQGALAVECRADDQATIDLLAAIDDPGSRSALEAERAFLVEVGGDCELPAGAYATVDAAGLVHLEALLASVDGTNLVRYSASGSNPAALGREVARHLLDVDGGAAILGRRGRDGPE